MKKHDACIATQYGWVEIDNNNKLAINCVKSQLHDDILQSDFYKQKENIYWPKVEKLYNYDNKKDDIISYYKTDYIYNILRYPEFTPFQFKEALIFLCEICLYCEKNNYYLRSHLWNVTFNKGNPILIDIRDFELLKSQSWNSIFISHFRETLDTHCPVHVKKFVKNYKDIKNRLNNAGNLNEIKKILADIIPINTNNGNWSNYYKDRLNFLKKSNSFDDEIYSKITNFKGGSGVPTKSINLFKYIEDIKPTTIIEMGCNSGLYSFGASKFSNVIGIDYDINSINEANKINSKLKTSTTFISLDLLKPFVSYGLDGSYGYPYERFKSELLIAPAIIHHLFKQCNSTDKIIEIFTNFTEKYMLIEQIPELINTDKLIMSIKKFGYDIVSMEESSPKPRFWIFCKKNIN